MCVELQQLIHKTRVPDYLLSELDSALVENLAGVRTFVVRSSSNAEDLAGFSAAGIYESYNHVTSAEKIVESVKEVWASLVSARSVRLRRQAGISLDDCFMGVVVQEQVNANFGGVMVTTNPMNRKDFRNVYINVSPNVTDVVEGSKQPMQYLYSTVEGGGSGPVAAVAFLAGLHVRLAGRHRVARHRRGLVRPAAAAVLDLMLGLRVPATPEVARAVRLTYGFQFFFGLLLWIPIFYEYQKQLGLSDAEIFGIQSIYYIAFCLMEIPTGMVADRFDHRTSLWLGASVLVVANVVPVLAGNYTGFLVHFLLIALARSLISGAQSAYLYKYLNGHNAGHLYLKVECVGRSYSLVGKIVYWPAIGLLMQWNMPSPYWLTAVHAAIAVVLALKLPPIPDWKRPEGKTSKLLAGVGGAFGALRTSAGCCC